MPEFDRPKILQTRPARGLQHKPVGGREAGMTSMRSVFALGLVFCAHTLVGARYPGVEIKWYHIMGLWMLVSGALNTLFGESVPDLIVGDEAPPLEGLKYVQRDADAPRVDPRRAGVVTVVELWATWCRPCIETVPHLDKLYRGYAASHPGDVQFVGVTGERDEAAILAFIAARDGEMSYPVAMDSAGKVSAAYAASYVPYAFVVGGDGKVVWRGNPRGSGLAIAIDSALLNAGKALPPAPPPAVKKGQ